MGSALYKGNINFTYYSICGLQLRLQTAAVVFMDI